VIGDTIIITTQTGGTPSTKPFEWVATRTGAGEVTTGTPTGTPGEQSMIDLESAFDLDNPTLYITTQTTNTLTIQSETLGEDFLGIIQNVSNTGVISVAFNNYIPPFDVTDIDLALVRSPYYVNTPFDFDTTTKATIDIRIWSGDVSTDRPAAATETITKVRPTIDYAEFNTNLSNIVRDRLEPVPIITLTGATQVLDTPNTNIKWVEFIASYTDDVTQIADIQGTFVSSDGYGLYTEGVNPSAPANQILTDATYRKVSRDGIGIIAFVNDSTITSVDIDSDGVDLNDNIVITSSSNSTDYLQHLVIDFSQVPNDTYVTVTFNTASTTYVFTYEIIDECRYEAKQIVFKNKYGQFDTLTMNKKATTRIRTTSREFVNNYISSGTYDTEVHQIKKINIDATKSISLNSGYMSETENALYEQMLLSDKVYFYESGNLNPVNVENNSLEFKTRLNDRLVQYNIDFKYAYNTINNV
jgi:hypothetical protein